MEMEKPNPHAVPAHVVGFLVLSIEILQFAVILGVGFMFLYVTVNQMKPQEETWEVQENKMYYANGCRYSSSHRSMTEKKTS